MDKNSEDLEGLACFIMMPPGLFSEVDRENERIKFSEQINEDNFWEYKEKLQNN